MKKIFSILLIAVILLLVGCVSSNEKAIIADGFETYFSHLKNKEYDLANSMAFDADENDKIESEIKQNSVNDFIFEKLSFELWQISRQDEIYYADIIVKQLSLASAYGTTAGEFNIYLREAELSGKSFSQHALDETFDKMLFKNLQNEENYLKLKCSVPCRITDGKLCIGMTAEFRNCLFGGELDAIKSLNDF